MKNNVDWKKGELKKNGVESSSMEWIGCSRRKKYDKKGKVEDRDGSLPHAMPRHFLQTLRHPGLQIINVWSGGI